MDSSKKYAAGFSKAEPQPSYYKNALMAVGYAVGSTIVAFCIWPASAGDILAKFNAPAPPTFTSDVSNRIHNENRVHRNFIPGEVERGPGADRRTCGQEGST